MNNKTKLQEQGLTDLYYYNHSPNNSHSTACLLFDGEKVIAKGVAYCSPREQFIKRTGRNIACGRAVKALEHEVDMLPVRGDTSECKAQYFPYLSSFESDLLVKITSN